MTARRRYQPTPEDIAKAKEKRAKIREFSKRISDMTDAERQAILDRIGAVVTIEGRALSATNTMLLASQSDDLGRAILPTVVGGFRQWKKAGRHVRKGERGLSIWIPLMKGEKAEQTPPEEGEEHERQQFALATVFDVTQTDETTETTTDAEPVE